MAVEEEGLRVFQSVKIKIGKRKKPPPPRLISVNGSIFTGRQWGPKTGQSQDLCCSACYCHSRHTLSSLIGSTNDKSGESTKKEIEGLKAVWDTVGIWQLAFGSQIMCVKKKKKEEKTNKQKKKPNLEQSEQTVQEKKKAPQLQIPT